MTKDTEQVPKPNVPAACFLALLVLLSTTAILIHDTVVCLPRGPGIWNPRPQPTLLSAIVTTDRGVRLDEGSADEEPTERIESPWNAYRSGHWATATLFDLANKHDVWLIPTSWEYQDSTAWFVADPSIRAEIYGIPEERRFMHLAEQHDRLLRILKDRGLAHRIAYLEIHNEPEFSAFPRGAASRRLHQEAISLLNTRHPEILISGDFASHDYSLIPDNVQVFDQHVYAGSPWYFQELFGRTFRDACFNPDRPRDLESLRAVLRDDDLLSWKDFLPRAGSVKEEWKGFFWLYENLDNAKWDRWVAESFARWKDRIWQEATTRFTDDAQEAARRRLPQVLDEGGFFFPPRLSRFELSPPGLSLLDFCADLAIAHDYWGFMPGTYCGPEHLLWDENPEWLRRTNERFQRGRTGEPAGAGDA